jgi:hypothetical protein
VRTRNNDRVHEHSRVADDFHGSGVPADKHHVLPGSNGARKE